VCHGASEATIICRGACVCGGKDGVLWDQADLMPRPSLVSETRKTASTVAVFGGLLTMGFLLLKKVRYLAFRHHTIRGHYRRSAVRTGYLDVLPSLSHR
jgi:hypothetical protein